MKLQKQPHSPELSEDLQRYLQSVPAMTQSDLDELQDSAKELARDPKWRADYLKGLFVEQVLAAMEEEQLSQSELAARWGKSRQYVSKLLNEDERVNFTIETLCEVAHLLGRRVEVQVLRPNEIPHVLRTIPGKDSTKSPRSARGSKSQSRNAR